MAQTFLLYVLILRPTYAVIYIYNCLPGLNSIEFFMKILQPKFIITVDIILNYA